jgi:formylglycine-generating enzyme required for sulfatase activity
MQNVLTPPENPAEWPAWRERNAQWRRLTKEMLGYTGSSYEDPAFAWVREQFCECVLNVWDETFLDPERGVLAIDAVIERGERLYGGYDHILFWNSYPRIGLDWRNQFDFWRDLPGGLEGMRAVVDACHGRGVRCLIPFKPWDEDTHLEPEGRFGGIAEMVGALDLDGVFLDTMASGSKELRERIDAIRPGVTFNPEGIAPIAGLNTHHMGWAQGALGAERPGLLMNRFYEQRHRQFEVSRWTPHHVPEIQRAWLNGGGVCIWEDVFGTWVGCDAQSQSLLRVLLPALRRYAHLWAGARWTFPVEVGQPGLWASRWEGEGGTLWSVVNHSGAPVEGELIAHAGLAGPVFDLVCGEEVRVSGEAIHGSLRAGGAAGFITGGARFLGEGFEAFLAGQRERFAAARWSRAVEEHPERILVVDTPEATAAGEGMMAIRDVPAQPFRQRCHYRVRECGYIAGQAETAFRERPHEKQSFEREVSLRPFAIDLTAVTNASFARFVRETGYTPEEPANFLRHFVDGAPPPGKEEHPVVYVCLADARAYAAWAGKRLPSEEEWQFAAQGPHGRLWPWGGAMEPGRCNEGGTGGTPDACDARTHRSYTGAPEHLGSTNAVTAFPEGRSPYGCYDMCGNVWELTDPVRTNGRTRYVILKGGSFYQATLSFWYFDGGPRPADWGAKMILMGPRLDRCATVGFRCAAEL